MRGFIEVTQKGCKNKTLINITHIVSVNDSLITLSTFDISSGYGGSDSIEVVERYDEIYDKIYAASAKE